jgi:endonuclease/exonuclease/phosphatase family metal-dependent hydrolase
VDYTGSEVTRREQLVRAGLALLVVAVIAGLMVLDRARGNDRPTESDATPSSSASPSATPTDDVEDEEEVQPLPPSSSAAPGDKIPTPPPGIEDIACRKLQKSTDIRVLSFNTHRSFGPPGALEAVAREISAVQPDIVLLQEIDRFFGRTGGVDQAARFAELLGMDHVFGANVVQGGGQYGVAILSRFEIVGSDNYRLPNGPGGEPRGLLWAAVDIGGQPVRIYNTHLQNKLIGIREAQARFISGVLGNDDLPAILGGDMNATVNTPTLRALQAHLVDSWGRVGSGPSGTGPGGSKIDFLLASPTLVPQQSQVLGSAISDHSRLVADFVVPASTDCPKGRRKG